MREVTGEAESERPSRSRVAMIGASLRRREDPPLVRGQGQYVEDVRMPGMLHMAVVRSPYPHARVDRVDLEPASRLAGVLGAFALADLPEIHGPMGDPAPTGMRAAPRPVLAGDRVRYVGEPIAVIVAEDGSIARDAVDQVAIDFTPLDGVGNVLVANQPDAPILHESIGSNVAGEVERSFGDITSAFSAEATVVRLSVRLGRVIGGYMEPRGTAASVDASTGKLTVWTSTQWVFGVRDRITSILHLDRDTVHVVARDVGGGFGAKGQIYPEEILVPALARRFGRPVRWVASRTEDTQASGQSHGDMADAELAANRDGTLRGLRVRLQHDVGAYGGAGLGQSDNILSHVVSAYHLPALEAHSTVLYTNTVPTGFIRGGGREVGNFIIERLMDRLAQTVNIDPVEVRRRNLIQPEEMPYTTGYLRMGSRPVTYDGGNYPALLQTAIDAVDYAGARQEQADGAHIGIGIACCVESAGIQQVEPASLRIQPDGDVRVYVGSTPGGQGHRTVFAQVVADQLGWPVERVTVEAGDTEAVENSANTAGSRSALEVGNAAAKVASRARELLLQRAQAALEVAAADLSITPAGVDVRGVPGRHMSLGDLLDGDQALEAEDQFQSNGAFTSAVHAVVLKVDPELAAVQVLRYVISHDCGQPINPLLVNGQLQGGLVHGAGYALMEEAVYLEDGTFTTANFADYTIPGRGIPMELVPRLLDVRAPVLGNNPAGFKGIGETGTIAAPVAFAAALEDALHTFGIRADVTTLPVTPRRLFDFLTGAAV
ncbi:MAG TPA: xanthine dehydrogenase family protein molybdopterin-binding subunit [Chloroflexota bacterium]